MDMKEVSPASEWCQRWADGRHSFRHTSQGGFDPDLYEVRPVDELTAKRYIVGNHYSGSYPAASQRYGLFTGGRLVGVLVFGIPAQAKVLTNVLPGLAPYTESLELTRLVLEDSPAAPANSESWFIARCFEEAAAVGVRGIVSFADPVPRIVEGRLLFPGHIGRIYMASNAVYTGRGTSRTLTLLPNGSVLNDRSVQKIRKQERGHDHVEQLLHSLGAPVMRAGQAPAAWLADALDTIGVTRVRHGGNHRYVFPIGTRSQRRRVQVALPPSSYPKEVDAA